MKSKYRMGIVLLAVHLILVGLVQLLGLSFRGLGLLEGLLALLAGILLLVGQ